VVVLGDETSNPRYLAAELISQAEHSPGSSLLVTWRKEILDEVEKALNDMLSTLERGDLAKDCLEQFGAFVLAPDPISAFDCVNKLAPEHLHIATSDPAKHADQIDNAGAIFLGPYTVAPALKTTLPLLFAEISTAPKLVVEPIFPEKLIWPLEVERVMERVTESELIDPKKLILVPLDPVIVIL
jgi:hypothetical protein